LGLFMALAACGIIAVGQTASLLAAALLAVAWLCDRLDGQLARLQRTATASGAWLDANVDELIDVAAHTAVAWAASATGVGPWPWLLLAAFLGGKFLFFHSLSADVLAPHGSPKAATGGSWLRRLYHLPGNTDVRVHVLIAAVAGGWWIAELAIVAAYFNLRWLARYVRVAASAHRPELRRAGA
jgi:phosphatidylglycerophosphate synthase